MEIGGYIELEKNKGQMLHEEAVKLNCGRNALAYLIESKEIRAVAMPEFMCDSCAAILEKYNVAVRYYPIGLDFKPKDIKVRGNEWLYLVNFYGQLSNDYIADVKRECGNIIVDNAQAYFQPPLEGTDTLYTCRKFFGVSDGAVLYTDGKMSRDIPQDFSYERMGFLLGRFERTAAEFYSEYVKNNDFFQNEPIKKMSKLTENFLHGINYEYVKKCRTENFKYLHDKLSKKNKLTLSIPEGAFMYPFYVENGMEVRKVLQAKKIYIPTLWPVVFRLCKEGDLEYDMAQNILPLPVDQRYGIEDMEYLVSEAKESMIKTN